MSQVAIHGFARAGFEAVREAFADNFSRRHELGAACCYLPARGEGGRPVERDSEQGNR